MTHSAAALRLILEDLPDTDAVPVPGPRAVTGPVCVEIPMDEQVNFLQREIDSLQTEIRALHRRDDQINLFMDRIDEELRLAARLQQDFLPKTLPEVGPVRFHTLFRPAGYVSGDIYDVMRLDEHNVGFFMADAVGHGMPAALLTMFIKNALRTKEIKDGVYRLLPPSETLMRLNDQLVDQNLSQATFATAFYGRLDVRTMKCEFGRAGHPSPILMRANGKLEPLDADGGLLGVFPGECYVDGSTTLEPGDRVFLYTDGIEVALNDGQIVSTEQWCAELYRRRHLTSEQMLADFGQLLDKQLGSLTPKDDLSMLIVDVTRK